MTPICRHCDRASLSNSTAINVRMPRPYLNAASTTSSNGRMMVLNLFLPEA